MIHFSHTMVYINLFIVDPSYMQNIKQLRDRLPVCGCMICLYICLYDRFETLRDGPCLWVVHALNFYYYPF
jgi:hypothetical protein